LEPTGGSYDTRPAQFGVTLPGMRNLQKSASKVNINLGIYEEKQSNPLVDKLPFLNLKRKSKGPTPLGVSI